MIKKITLLGSIIFFTLLFIYCTTDESTITGPFGNADRYISIANFSADKPILYSNGDTTIVRIKVLDRAKTPVIGLIVNFSAQFGSITESGTTDSSGIALATFISDGNIGENIITADTGVKKDTLTLRIVHYQPVHNQPKYIELLSDSPMLLADGISKVNIIAKVYDSENAVIPGAVFDFSTTMGSLNDTTGVRANQEGLADVTLTSAGSIIDTFAIVKAVVTADTSISEEIKIQIKGITSFTYIDSFKMSDEGIYKAYIRTNLRETTSATNISDGAVLFSSPEGIGTMVPSIEPINENGTAFSVFSAEVLPIYQNNIIITSELSSSPVVSSVSEEFDIPGAEILINTLDDQIMGDGVGWALARATLSETSGRPIANTEINWSTSLGTIIGQSKTDSHGRTIGTLHIENSVSSDTDVTIKAKWGDNISASDIVTFISPVNSNRIILGTEPDIIEGPCVTFDSLSTCVYGLDASGRIIIGSGGGDPFYCGEIGDTWCYRICGQDIIQAGAFGTRDIAVTAIFKDENSIPLYGQTLRFWLTPADVNATICEQNIVPNSLGYARVTLTYPKDHGGDLVRIWAGATDGTKGSIDIVLPVVAGE